MEAPSVCQFAAPVTMASVVELALAREHQEGGCREEHGCREADAAVSRNREREPEERSADEDGQPGGSVHEGNRPPGGVRALAGGAREGGSERNAGGESHGERGERSDRDRPGGRERRGRSSADREARADGGTRAGGLVSGDPAPERAGGDSPEERQRADPRGDRARIARLSSRMTAQLPTTTLSPNDAACTVASR